MWVVDPYEQCVCPNWVILWRVWRTKFASKAGQEYQEFRQVQRTAKKMLWRILISKLLILVECLKFPKLQRGN